jgi:hypothetical protein
MMINTYKFDPEKHGYESIIKFPELDYNYPMMDGVWYVKIIAYSDYGYWYSAITLSVGPAGDDRVKIYSGAHDTRELNPDKQCKNLTVYCGLIPSDEYAKELLMTLFSTTKNDSVKTDGLQRYERNLNLEMRKKFNK